MSGLNGWLILDKPVGPGSTDIVSRVKRALREGGYAKVKVGHGGTLDPLASGVLPVALGEATKLAGRMLDSDKAYAFTVRFGVETDTLDREGTIVATSDVRPSSDDIASALPRLTGVIEQVPPAYSALKVDGRRAYDRARDGEVVELVARDVTVRSLSLDGTTDDEATLTAEVSKGTYIRSLARDIAYACDTVGHVTMLRRTKAGPFTLERAISLDTLTELAMARELEQALLSLRAGLDDIPALSLTPDQAGALRQGRVLTGIAAYDGQAFAMLDDEPIALVDIRAREARVVRGFNL